MFLNFLVAEPIQLALGQDAQKPPAQIQRFIQRAVFPAALSRSKARVIFSPTALPMDAIIKWESIIMMTAREP